MTPTSHKTGQKTPSPRQGRAGESPTLSHPAHPRGLLAGMRIRKKLMFLHTLFSIVLAIVLVLALHPAISHIVLDAQTHRVLDRLELYPVSQGIEGSVRLEGSEIAIRQLGENELSSEMKSALLESDLPIVIEQSLRRIAVVSLAPQPEQGDGRGEVEGGWIQASLASDAARDAVFFVDFLIILAVLGVYAIVAASLELFVLPRHVYAPLRAALHADEAVRSGDRFGELIPPEMMPADELGAIMRSRNQSILELRAGEAKLADTLDRLESVATDLKRKNHLLENARKNLEGADRLRSLGMMSAGIAHEINTPLAVAKGLVEKLGHQSTLSKTEAALLARVITRLESLSDSLLDFARARSLEPVTAGLNELAEEAATLVRLDRNTMPKGDGIRVLNTVPSDLTLECEADRIIQVLVNLIRNAVNAIRGAGHDQGEVSLASKTLDRDGQRWVLLTVTDSGPGIDSELLPQLFEPFVSTRLDSRGTGLGLAVADGIVREHGGTLLARNRPDRAGALFEVMLPQIAAKLDTEPPNPETHNA